MVTVPRVSEQPGGNVRLDAPGVIPVQDQTGRQLQQAGRSLQFAGQGVQRLGDEIKERNDTARISEADSLFGDFVRQRLNPRDGYRSLQGKAAGDQYDAVRRELESKRDEIARTLQTDEQRQVFNRAAQARAGQAQGVIDTHAARQTSIYEAAQHSAAVQGYQADYIENLGNPRAMGNALVLMRDRINAFADDMAVAPEVREQMHMEATTTVHASAIDGLIAQGDAGGARDYFRVNEKAMGVDMREKARRIIGRAEVGDRAQALFLKHQGKSFMDVAELADKEHAAGNISDAVREEWVQRAERRTLQERRETAERARSALTNAQTLYADGPLSPTVREELEETGQAWKFEAWAKNQGAWQTSDYGWKKLNTVTAQELREFKSADEVWDYYRTELDDRDLAAMVGKWNQLQVALGKASAVGEEDNLTITRLDHMTSLWQQLPGNADLDPSDNRDAVKAFGVDVDRRANLLMKDGKMGLIEARDQAAKEIGSLVTTTGKPYLTLGKAERQGATIVTPFGNIAADTIKPEMRKEAIKHLEKQAVDRGQPLSVITEAMILARVVQKHKQDDVKRSQNLKELRARGRVMLLERVRHIVNDPEATREVRRRSATALSNTDRLTGATSTRVVHGHFKSALREYLFEQLEDEFVSQYGLDPNDINQIVEAMAGDDPVETRSRRRGGLSIGEGGTLTRQRRNPSGRGSAPLPDLGDPAAGFNLFDN